jgi:hypothetical protein
MILSLLVQASVIAVAGVTLVNIYKRIAYRSPYKHITGPSPSSWIGESSNHPFQYKAL